MKTLPVLALALLLPACATSYSRDWMAAAPLDPAPLAAEPVAARPYALPSMLEDKAADKGAKQPAPPDQTGKPTTLKKYYGPAGGYFGASMLYGFEQFDVSGPESATNSRIGLSVRGGWRIPEGYAAEVVLEDANDFRIRSGGGFDADLDILSVGVQGKYFFTHEQTQPYFMAGFGLATAQIEHMDDDSGAYFRIGAGIEHYIKEDMALFVEFKFDQLFGEVNDLDHFDIQAGVIIHF